MEYLMPFIVSIVLTFIILSFSVFINKIKNSHMDSINDQIMELLGSINESNSDIRNRFIATKKKAYNLNEVNNEVAIIKQNIKRIENDIKDINKSIDELKTKTHKKRG